MHKKNKIVSATVKDGGRSEFGVSCGFATPYIRKTINASEKAYVDANDEKYKARFELGILKYGSKKNGRK